MLTVKYAIAGATALSAMIGLAMIPQQPSTAQPAAPQRIEEPIDGSFKLAQVGAVSTYRPRGLRGVVLFLTVAGISAWSIWPKP